MKDMRYNGAANYNRKAYFKSIGAGKYNNQASNESLVKINEKFNEIQEMIKSGMTGEELRRVLIYGNKESVAEITPEPKPIKAITIIRKTVATLANQIFKKLKNLSASFKKAWQVVKGKIIQSKITDVTFGNTQTALQRLTRYNQQEIKAELVRESDCKHDENAIAVTISVKESNPYKIGYLPRDLAAYIANYLTRD